MDHSGNIQSAVRTASKYDMEEEEALEVEMKTSEKLLSSTVVAATTIGGGGAHVHAFGKEQYCVKLRTLTAEC